MTQETQNDDTSPEPVAVSDIVADAKAWLADTISRPRTHSASCHHWHSECLVAKLIREIELQRACASAGREEIARLKARRLH